MEVRLKNEDLAAILIEIWRLDQVIAGLSDTSAAAALRRISRRLQGAVASFETDVIDLAGRVYDPGMPADVIDVEYAQAGAQIDDIVATTVEPTVVIGGRIVTRGQIVLRKAGK